MVKEVLIFLVPPPSKDNVSLQLPKVQEVSLALWVTGLLISISLPVFISDLGASMGRKHATCLSPPSPVF